MPQDRPIRWYGGFVQPLLHEDDNKHSCYHKIQTVCIELKQIAHQTADGCSAEPVKMVEQRDKEIEPAAVHICGGICRAVAAEGFIAHAENQVRLLPSQTAAENGQAHQHGIPKAETGHIHVNAAGVSPSQAPIEAILKVDLYGTAILLEEVGKVIASGGVGVTISSQSGWRMPALTAQQDEQLATTPTEELLSLDILQPGNIRDTLHAYQMAKRCNEKRVMAQSVEWGKRGARLNAIAPGIIVTPLAIDEFNGIRGDFYKNMFAKCPAGRPGTADEVANVAELLMSDKGAFITGSTFLIDGGATASYYYGSLKPQ